jgi:malate dehydrogenase
MPRHSLSLQYFTKIMTTAAIIGAGNLGGAIAHALATRESVSRVLLVDSAGTAAAGKALDILQAGAIQGFHTRLDGTDDPSRIIGATVCIVADRFGAASVEWQGDEGLGQLVRLAPFIGEAPIVLAGASQADLLLKAAREGRFRRERLVGSAPEGLAAAIRAIVAMEAHCSPAEVMLTVLGTPPDGFVVPWSEASIGGYALEHVLDTVQLNRVEARTRRLWPPGAYALGLIAACVAEAIVTSSRSAFSLLTVLGGEFGVRDRVGALPVLLSRNGIVHTRVPSLSARERTQVETALAGAR